MKKTKIAMVSLCLGSLIALSLPEAQAASKEKDGEKVLKEFQMSAAAVAAEANELSMGIRAGDWDPEVHSYRLNTIREEVNRMGGEMSTLEHERGVLTSLEQQAVDKTLPLLQEIAAKTESAITYFTANKGHLWAETYRGDVDNVRQDSEQISKTVKNYLKYAKVQDQEQRLQQNLEMGATKSGS